MEITIYLAKFWGSLFMILGGLSILAKFLNRVIEYTEDKTITISTWYITFLLGLITVTLHNIRSTDRRLAITILGWITLLKGIEKIWFPNRVHKKAQLFKTKPILWGSVIFLIGAWFFSISLFIK